jgi:hypothetical protein
VGNCSQSSRAKYSAEVFKEVNSHNFSWSTREVTRPSIVIGLSVGLFLGLGVREFEGWAISFGCVRLRVMRSVQRGVNHC